MPFFRNCGDNLKRENFKIILALTTVTQAGLSVFSPVVILGVLSKFLISKFNAPDYLFLIAIIVGVFCGFYNMIKFLYITIKKDGEE